MADHKTEYTDGELNALDTDIRDGEVYVKKVTRYVVVRAERRKMVFPSGDALPCFQEVDLGEFRRKDEADKVAKALNSVSDWTEESRKRNERIVENAKLQNMAMQRLNEATGYTGRLSGAAPEYKHVKYGAVWTEKGSYIGPLDENNNPIRSQFDTSGANRLHKALDEQARNRHVPIYGSPDITDC